MPWKYNGSTLPYSKIKSPLSMFFKRKKHVVIVSLPNSTLFEEAVKEQEAYYVINYCSNGFEFLNLCYTSKNVSMFFVTQTRYGGTLGFYVGNNVNTMMGNVKLLLVEPYSKGGLYVNNSFYTLFPSEIFTQIKHKQLVIDLINATVFSTILLIVIIMLVNKIHSHSIS